MNVAQTVGLLGDSIASSTLARAADVFKTIKKN